MAIVGHAIQRAYPRLDLQIINDAVVDAILKCLQESTSYDQSRGGLVAFVRTIAQHHVIDRIRREQRRRLREAEVIDRLLDHARFDRAMTDDTALPDGTERADGLGTVRAAAGEPECAEVLANAMAGLSPMDQQYLTLRLAGEKRTAVLAGPLGVADRRAPEQRQAVKRTYDRLRVRLRRAARRAASSDTRRSS
jgi:RNA polymerase sigma factor (sigma-70 family)